MEEEEAKAPSVHSAPKSPSVHSAPKSPSVHSAPKSPSVHSAPKSQSVQSTPKSQNGIEEIPKSPVTPIRSTSPARSTSPTKVSLNLSNRSAKGDPIVQNVNQIGQSIKNIADHVTGQIEDTIDDAISKLDPQGESIMVHVEELSESVNKLSQNIEDPQSPGVGSNIDKIAKMSKVLTNEANSLRASIKSLSEDIARTKQEIKKSCKEDVNFPYHLFLIELIINKIHMKCECFEIDYNNLVISATFLGKQPIILYDSSYGKIENFSRLNVGKSTLFAMTYDKICRIKEFVVILQLTKEPPCSTCITKIAETQMDYTAEFIKLREELCKKWSKEKPKDNIIYTTSTPLSKSLFYLSCCDNNTNPESIGVVEVSMRMSFLGKEITTAFSATPKPIGTSLLLKEDNGMTMYSCHKVEMDNQGKILLDEDTFSKKDRCTALCVNASDSLSMGAPSFGCRSPHQQNYIPNQGGCPKYDEIFTKMNDNELKIRVPKSTKIERSGKYDRIQELCSCEDNPYNTGEQVQFELPRDLCYPDKTHNTYTSNLKYTYKGCDRTCERRDQKDKKVVNVTPSNCPVPVDMEKVYHPQKDVFILKIGKKLETRDKKTDLEIELVTPKLVSEKSADNTNVTTQSSNYALKEKGSKKGGKKGAKKGGKKEGKKGGKNKKKSK